MISCDPSSLANAARCFDQCIPEGFQMAVRTSLLCAWANRQFVPTEIGLRIIDTGEFRILDNGDFREYQT
jgi:hypothetical protein